MQLQGRAVAPIYAAHDLLGLAKMKGQADEGTQAVNIPPDITPESEARLREASPLYHVRENMPGGLASQEWKKYLVDWLRAKLK